MALRELAEREEDGIVVQLWYLRHAGNFALVSRLAA